MPATIEEPTQERLDCTRAGVHSACVVCGAANRLGIRFAVASDGSVVADTVCAMTWQGYAGVVQGGVVAALLDSAMTNCLFARGIVAVTAELNIRYCHPVATNRALRVRGRLTAFDHPLFRLVAEIEQDNRVAARARATFYSAAAAPGGEARQAEPSCLTASGACPIMTPHRPSCLGQVARACIHNEYTTPGDIT